MIFQRVGNCRIWTCALLLVLAPLSVSWAAGLAIDDSVPEGFESLERPRPMLVDIMFNDQIAGTATVMVEGDLISFDDPQQILSMLDSVRPDDALRTAVAMPQNTHVEHLCYRPGEPVGCGTLDPQPFAVLFDEDVLTATVFVDPALQAVRVDDTSRYLDPPHRRGSAALALDATAVSIGSRDWEHALRAESWLGYGRGYLRSIVGFDSVHGQVQLDSMALVHRLQDHEVLAGTYAFQAGPLMPGFEVLGLRIASSMQTRIDPDGARGSELSVLLDRRSLVQLYVNDRLYSTQSLDAGHVAIDTSDLPDGNMQVELRIADPVSGLRTEYHRFTRSTLLPPQEETAMVFALGAPLQLDGSGSLPQLHRIGVGSLRIARRTGESTALALGLSHLGDTDLLQPEFVMLSRHLTLQASASFGMDGEHGAGLLAVWQRGALAASLSGEWFDDGKATSVVSSSPILEKHWMPDDTAQLTATVDALIGRTSIGLYGSVRRKNDALGADKSVNIGISARHRLFERAGLRSSLAARLRRENGVVSASLDLRVTFGGRSRLTSILAGVSGTEQSRTSANGRDADTTQSIVGMETRWHEDSYDEWQFEAGVWANAGSADSTVGVDAGVVHQNFSADIQSQWRDHEGAAVPGIGNSDTAFRFSTQIVMDGSGMALAGNDSVRAGLVLDVEGEPEGAEYDILVNSARVGMGRVGTPAFVALPPFARYEVQLQPHSLLASTFEQESFDVTLYPGNILRMKTLARERHLLIATVVDTDGELLSNAVLQRDGGPLMVGSDGLLQLEMSSGEVFDVLEADGSSCVLTMPEQLAAEEVVVLDTSLVCQ